MKVNNFDILLDGRDAVSAVFEFDPFLTVCCEDFGAKTTGLFRDLGGRQHHLWYNRCHQCSVYLHVLSI